MLKRMLEKLSGGQAPAEPPLEAVGMIVRPMAVNPSLEERHRIAAYRLDAIRRAITQREAEPEQAYTEAWLAKTRQFYVETVVQADILRSAGLLSEDSAHEAMGFAFAALARAKRRLGAGGA